MTHIANLIFNTPLMVEPGKLAVFLNAAGNRILPANFDFDVLGKQEEWMRQSREERNKSIDSYVATNAITEITSDGNKILNVDGARIYELNIFGSLTQRASMFDSGGMNYDKIRSQFYAAMDDSEVDAVMLQVDSPGGSVAGNFDLADDIYNARDVKPIWAVSNEAAYSAAYSLASSAEALFATRTAGLGSIGVIAIHVDQSKFNEKVGIEVTPIFAGAYKNDLSPHAPLSDEAYQRLQSEVNDIYSIFVNTVARNRNISSKIVQDTEAATFMGADAVSVGLADDITTYAQAVEGLAATILNKGVNTMGLFSKKKVEAEAKLTATEALATLDESYETSELEAALAEVGYIPAAGMVSADEAHAALTASVESEREKMQREHASELVEIEKKAEFKTRAAIVEILELCQVAGVGVDVARQIVKDGMSPSAAKTMLQEMNARIAEVETVNAVIDAGPGSKNPLLEDARKRATASDNKTETNPLLADARSRLN